MSKIKTIVLDVDDVLLKYVEGFRNYANDYYNFGMEGLPEKYSLDGWMPCDAPLRREIMGKFNRSWQFGCLFPLTSAVDFVHRVIINNGAAKVYNGPHKWEEIELVALSKCGKDPITTALRKANLTHIFGMVFSEIILIDGSESKKHAIRKLKRHRKLVLSVDDYVLNCVEMIECGVPTVIMRNSTNVNITERYPEIPVAEDWNDLFYNYIKPLLGKVKER